MGFPLGASASSVKVFEATQCLKDGAEEIDMVIALGKMKAGDYGYVLRDIWYLTFVLELYALTCALHVAPL